MANIFNQNHSGSGDNIVNFGRPEFKLTDDDMRKILVGVQGCQSVYLQSVSDWGMGDRLASFLNANGVAISKYEKVGVLVSVPPHKKPVQIILNHGVAEVILDPS